MGFWRWISNKKETVFADWYRYIVQRSAGCMHNICTGSLREEMVVVPILTTQARLAGSTTTALPLIIRTTRLGLPAREKGSSWKYFLILETKVRLFYVPMI